jgi:CRISPR-associated protein Cas5d
MAMFQRRAEKGQCFSQPSFGCREFPAHFELADESVIRPQPNPNPNAELGLMLYDVFDLDVSPDQKPGKVEKTQPRVTFFRATLKDGVMNVPAWAEVKSQLGGAH